jgi:hypothetical protein
MPSMAAVDVNMWRVNLARWLTLIDESGSSLTFDLVSLCKECTILCNSSDHASAKDNRFRDALPQGWRHKSTAVMTVIHA